MNNIVEQDHRRIKWLICPGLGFGSFGTARRTLAGYEAMAMIRKGQVQVRRYFELPEDILNDPEKLCLWASEAMSIASKTKPNKALKRDAAKSRRAP